MMVVAVESKWLARPNVARREVLAVRKQLCSQTSEKPKQLPSPSQLCFVSLTKDTRPVLTCAIDGRRADDDV